MDPGEEDGEHEGGEEQTRPLRGHLVLLTVGASSLAGGASVDDESSPDHLTRAVRVAQSRPVGAQATLQGNAARFPRGT